MIGIGIGEPYKIEHFLSNVIGWYRADNVTPNSTTASAMQDISQAQTIGNLTQGTTGNQPTINLSDSSYNNKASLSFTRASSQELLSSTVSSVAGPYTCITVGNTNASNITQAFGTLSAGPTWTMLATGPSTLDIDGGSGVVTSGTTTYTSPCVLAAVYVSGSNTAKIYNNASGTPIITGNAGGGTRTQMAMGSTVGGNFLDGKIAEVIIVHGDASADPNWQQLFLYLGQYYNISTS